MVNAALRSSWLIVAWLFAVTMIVAASMAMGANLSTTAVLLALGIAPVIVIGLLAHPEPAPSVAQMLRSGDRQTGRDGTWVG
jgi:hypothetical protein